MAEFIDITELGKVIPQVRQTQVNTASSNKFRLSFSNIPRITKEPIDIQLLTAFYKGINFPGMSLGTIVSTFMRTQRHHPLDKGNQDLNKISLPFSVSENYENYMYLRKWMWDMKNGVRPEWMTHLVDYNVKDIILTIMDNQKRDVVRLTFSDCLLDDLSDLDLSGESSGDLQFTTSWIYHHFDVEFFSIYTD